MKILDRILYKLGYVPNSIDRTLRCAWCAKEFQWVGKARDSHPSYCTSGHRKKAQDARKKRKEVEIKRKEENYAALRDADMNKLGRCPTPFKQVHVNVEHAQVVIDRVDPTMRPYRCLCGAIHIGHSSKGKK